ncbi:MAG: NADH-quinone oxidoreductase subunit M [Deltaproteobacteria bacterium]|nr:NADH-quinone oxidoreductase subunit M [Deltaproteobacteria bacterium]
MLSWITFIPLIGMGIILLLPRNNANLVRWTSLISTTIPLLLGFGLFAKFDRGSAAAQFVERVPWIPAFNIEYFIGVDGLSVAMVLLTVLLCFICVIASWRISDAVKGYHAMFLLLETGMLGVFCALDFFLFFIFWEAMLLPMYFLIGIWGGRDKVYAAIKFFLYTLFGSVLMLLVLLGMYYYSQPHGFDLIQLASTRPFASQTITLLGWQLPLDKVFWVLLFVGFAIKVPIWPFHTWLPWAHVEAPTAVSVVLAGVLLKMGTYGMLRMNFAILPEATKWACNFLAILAVINIIYGAFCAMAQKDLKKLVAYSSISHMGYVLLGMASFTAAGVNGAVLQMFNHGTSTAMLFLLVGVIYDRVHHRWIVKPDGSRGFGGIAAVMPVYTGIMGLAVFASLGLPGLSGFISEALVFLGAFSVPKLQIYVVIGSLGIILGAAYLLWMFMRIFLGPLNDECKALPDMSWRERLALLPLCVLVIVLGVYPMPVLDLMSASISQLLTLFS